MTATSGDLVDLNTAIDTAVGAGLITAADAGPGNLTIATDNGALLLTGGKLVDEDVAGNVDDVVFATGSATTVKVTVTVADTTTETFTGNLGGAAVTVVGDVATAATDTFDVSGATLGSATFAVDANATLKGTAAQFTGATVTGTGAVIIDGLHSAPDADFSNFDAGLSVTANMVSDGGVTLTADLSDVDVLNITHTTTGGTVTVADAATLHAGLSVTVATGSTLSIKAVDAAGKTITGAGTVSVTDLEGDEDANLSLVGATAKTTFAGIKDFLSAGDTLVLTSNGGVATITLAGGLTSTSIDADKLAEINAKLVAAYGVAAPVASFDGTDLVITAGVSNFTLVGGAYDDVDGAGDVADATETVGTTVTAAVTTANAAPVAFTGNFGRATVTTSGDGILNVDGAAMGTAAFSVASGTTLQGTAAKLDGVTASGAGAVRIQSDATDGTKFVLGNTTVLDVSGITAALTFEDGAAGDSTEIVVGTGSTLTLTAAQAGVKTITGAGQVVITELASTLDADLDGIATNLTIDLGRSSATLAADATLNVATGKTLTVTSTAGTEHTLDVSVISGPTGVFSVDGNISVGSDTTLKLTAAQATTETITGAGSVVITALDATTDAALDGIATDLTIDLGTTNATLVAGATISVAAGKTLTVTSVDEGNSSATRLEVTSATTFDIGAGSSVAIANDETELALTAAQATGHSITGAGDAWIILNTNGQVTATTDLSGVLSEVNFATSADKNTALGSVAVLTGATLTVDASKIGTLGVTGAGALVISAATAATQYDFSGLTAATTTVQYGGGTLNLATDLGTVQVENTTGTVTMSAAGAADSQLFGAGGFDITGSAGAQVIRVGGTGSSTINTGANNDTINLTTTSGTQTIVIDTVNNPTDINTINATGIGATYVVNASVGNQINAAASTQAITINGSSSADTITGGRGNDVIKAGGGNDTINLVEGGSDRVVFSSTAVENGQDTIFGFVGGTGVGKDVLDFSTFLTTRSFDVTVFTAASDGNSDIANKIVMFDTAGAGLDVDGLIAEIEGTGNAFALNGKAVVITGNASGTGNDALVYFVDTSLDGNASNVSSTDVVLVGTIGSFDLDTLHADNFTL